MRRWCFWRLTGTDVPLNLPQRIHILCDWCGDTYPVQSRLLPASLLLCTLAPFVQVCLSWLILFHFNSNSWQQAAACVTYGKQMGCKKTDRSVWNRKVFSISKKEKHIGSNTDWVNWGTNVRFGEISQEATYIFSNLVQEGINNVLRSEVTRSDAEMKQRALDVAGRFRSGLGDLSRRHDEYSWSPSICMLGEGIQSGCGSPCIVN